MIYRPTARVLTALELLQSHERMTGAELARRLEVHIRTVRDYQGLRKAPCFSTGDGSSLLRVLTR